MHKKIFLMIWSIFVLLFIIGCNNSNQALKIDEFSISYLEIQEDKYLVGDQVSIQAKVENADQVELLVREYGENQTEGTIEGEKKGTTWEFSYENKEPFMKEICLLAEDGTGETIQSEKKIITNQDQSYENAFENIIPVSKEMKEDFTLSTYPISFNILGWYDNQSILGYDNHSLILYHINNQQSETIYEDVWNVYPSTNFKDVVYENKDGIYFSDIAKRNNKKIFATDKTITLKDLVWSGNQRSLLLNIIEDQKNLLYLANLVNGDLESIDLDFLDENLYSLDKLISFEGDFLYALGSVVDEENKQTELSKALLGINIRTGYIKDYTSKIHHPIDEMKILSRVNDSEFLIRASSEIISEEKIQSNNDVYLLNTKNATLKSIKKDIDYPYVYSLSPNKDSYIYLKNVIEDGNLISNKKFIVFAEKHKQETTILQAIEYFPTSFYWSEDSKKVVFYMDNTKKLYYMQNKS